jgi:membrane associated rhomboid family serine protease
MCRNCGALVGANESSCSLCGAAQTSPATSQNQARVPHAHDGETIRFARAILSRPYIFTIIFLVANIFVFMLMWSSSGLNSVTLWEPPYPVLLAYGAKLNFLVREHNEWWRLVTPVFIHIGLAHLLVNMYGLWMIGPYVERLYGSAKFVVLWVGTGIAGVVASYLSVQPEMAVGPIGRFLFRTSDGPSAGASGALFGLIGVLFVFGIKFRRELPEGFKRAFGTGLLPVILLNLFIGYLGRGFIDNAAHLGGLFSGALFALVIGYKRPGERASVAVFWHVLQGLALILVAISFVMVVRHFKDYISRPNNIPVQMAAGDDASNALSYLNALSAGEGAFVAAYNKGDVSGIQPALEQIENAPRLDEEAEGLRNDLKSLLTRIKEFTETKPEGQKPAQAREQKAKKNKLSSDFVAWQKKQLEWVKTHAEKYGIRLQQPDSSKPDSPAAKESK